ncbi:hypothetical protein M0802_011073 [Mischocyttarus mexicanus]|nr:hypothetical protein M0802_011073 [Mischocyttarus mexicanus]
MSLELSVASKLSNECSPFGYFLQTITQQHKIKQVFVNRDYCNHIGTFIAGILRRKKVRRFTLQIETCVRAMDQLNIPMNLSKCFWQQCYVILIFVFFLIIMIVIDYSWLVIIGTSFWRICVAFYIERYPFIVLLITDFTIIFWMWYIKEKFRELNKLLKSMLTSTINSPQHKRVIGMSNNWENNPSSSDIIHTHKSNDNVLKIKKIRYIKIKFSQLNVVLKRMLTTTINLPQHKRVLQIWNNEKNNDLGESVIHGTNKSDKNIIKLKQIREIHLELIKCAKNINNAYGLHILMSISTGFILIVAVCYNAYNFVKASNYTQHPFQMYAFSYWIFHNGFKIFVISYVCSSAATEFHKDSLYEIIILPSFFFLHATNTGDILCELYEPSTSKEFRKEIHNFTLQLIQNQLSFTACGFFDLDNKLIYCIIGSVTTYLVILIQIGGVPYLIFSTDSTL